jgi:hypothetical protein
VRPLAGREHAHAAATVRLPKVQEDHVTRFISIFLITLGTFGMAVAADTFLISCSALAWLAGALIVVNRRTP